jgi:hypothetical protein
MFTRISKTSKPLPLFHGIKGPYLYVSLVLYETIYRAVAFSILHLPSTSDRMGCTVIHNTSRRSSSLIVPRVRNITPRSTSRAQHLASPSAMSIAIQSPCDNPARLPSQPHLRSERAFLKCDRFPPIERLEIGLVPSSVLLMSLTTP